MGKFKEGNPGGPGRPKGSLSGRSQCLAILDKMMAEAGNQKKLARAFQERFDAKPLLFWAQYVVPLVPKETKLDLDGNGIAVRIEFVEAKKPDDSSA